MHFILLQGDEYDRRLGAKSFDMAPAAAAAGSSSSDEEGSEEEDEEEDEDESGNPLDIDSEDLVAGVEYEKGACGVFGVLCCLLLAVQ
jgi:ribosomal protein L12E/L44/L45/RPP1/RPP2